MAKKRTSRKQPVAELSNTPSKPLIELSEEEQWRLVNQSEILHKVANVDSASDDPTDGTVPDVADEWFNAILLIIPFSFALLLTEILIHRQYGDDPTFQDIMDRMLPGVPILSIFIFYTNRHKKQRWMQFILFVTAITAGTRIIWIVNRANWRVNKKQCPPLATTWIYTVVQLDLPQAVFSLVIVGVWAWLAEMKILY